MTSRPGAGVAPVSWLSHTQRRLTSQPVQDTGDRIGAAFAGHVHKELVFLKRGRWGVREDAASSTPRALVLHSRLFPWGGGFKSSPTKRSTHAMMGSSAKPRAFSAPAYGVMVLSLTASP